MDLNHSNESVVVKNTQSKGMGVFSIRPIYQGEVTVIGRRIKILSERTIYSLQMEANVHVELDKPSICINHSCEPNTGVRNNQFGGYNFIALRDIQSGEEITFDYETTEYYSIAVPICCCNSDKCRKIIRGYHFLSDNLRDRYGEYIADYLKHSSDCYDNKPLCVYHHKKELNGFVV